MNSSETVRYTLLSDIQANLPALEVVLVHGAPTRNTLYWTRDRSDDFCRKMADRVGLAR